MNDAWITYLSDSKQNETQVRLEHWKALEEKYCPTFWSQLVNRVVEAARTQIHSDSAAVQGYKSQLIGIKAVFVVPA